MEEVTELKALNLDYLRFEEETIRDFIPRDAYSEFLDVLERYGDVKVLCEVDGCELPFPDLSNRYRNISWFAIMADGRMMGFNESPRSGYAFPVIGRKKILKCLEVERKWAKSPLKDWYIKTFG